MKVLEVAAGLIFRDGKLLIAQRYQDAHVGGLWEFPGGKRECDESFEQCLRRELKEELGIDVDVRELVETITHQYSDRTVQLNFYRCRLTDGEPKALGCPAFAWVSREELKNFQFPAADSRLLEKLSTDPKFWA
jgi:mutator protein MutT